MATPTAATHHRREGSEEEAAVTGVVMAITSAAGAMLVVLGTVQGAIPLVTVPAVMLFVALARHAVPGTAWAAAAVWCAILPLAEGVALLAPAMMIVLCVAIAAGPDRFVAWIRGEWAGRDATDPAAAAGWIEDDTDRP